MQVLIVIVIMMTNTKNEISVQDDGYLISDRDSKEKTLFFPKAELLNVGCRNCVWKLNSQCPYGYVDEQAHVDGICMEMLDFFGSLAEDSDTVSGVWEKFLLYKVRLQESEDYADFKRLEEKIKNIEKNIQDGNTEISSDKLYEMLERLKSDKMTAKLWWVKLNQHALFHTMKVRDREVKVSGDVKLPGIMSAQTINFNIAKVPLQAIEGTAQNKDRGDADAKFVQEKEGKGNV